MNNDSISYHWPTPIDPQSERCFVVKIPDDPLYWGIFWDRFEFLGKWVTWKRDEAKTATLVAQVWKPLIDESRALFEQNPTIYIDTRQSTGDPLIIEGLKPCGTWEQIIDLNSYCSGGYTMPPSPYTEDTPANQTQYAYNVTEWMRLIALQLVEAYCNGDSFMDLRTLWNGWVAPIQLDVAKSDSVFNSIYSTLTTIDCGTNPASVIVEDEYVHIYNGIRCDLDATVGWTGKPHNTTDPVEYSELSYLAQALVVSSLNWFVDLVETIASVLSTDNMNLIASDLPTPVPNPYPETCDWRTEFCLDGSTLTPGITPWPDSDGSPEFAFDRYVDGLVSEYQEFYQVSTGAHDKGEAIFFRMQSEYPVFVTKIEVSHKFLSPFGTLTAWQLWSETPNSYWDTQNHFHSQPPPLFPIDGWTSSSYVNASGINLNDLYMRFINTVVYTHPEERGKIYVDCIAIEGSGHNPYIQLGVSTHYLIP